MKTCSAGCVSLLMALMIGSTEIKAESFGLSIVFSERVRLMQPIFLRIEGQWQPIKDIMLLYVRPASTIRFLPKGDMPVAPLYPPIRRVWALVTPIPSGVLSDTDLWISESEAITGEATRKDLTNLHRQTQRLRPHDVIRLSKAEIIAATTELGPLLEDRAALLEYALRRADSLGESE